MKNRITILFMLLFGSLFGQNKIIFDGQASGIISYSPKSDLEIFSGIRYIPKLSYAIKIDSFSEIDFEASINVNGIFSFHPFSESLSDSHLSPYRLWARYTGKQFELRAGLQKMEFGSASILRPLQWFNQIDPRDPLQLTNGVYGLLGRYYFLNNMNIWVWGLYGNEKTRGFDAFETNKSVPEFGGRIQHPVSKGELGLTYHHRNADASKYFIGTNFEKIPENRIGIDGKWDVGIGLWFEASHVWKQDDLSFFTHQTALNIGFDYTFGLGNGLGFIAENMLLSADKKAFDFSGPYNFTAVTMAYPLTFFDNINAVMYYSWKTADFTFLVNYSHQFSHVDMYIMAYYNPENPQGIQQNDLVYSFSGPGLRMMFVYNH